MNGQPIDSKFPERLHPFLTFVLKRGDGRFWKLNASAPENTKNSILFSGSYERLDPEYLITSNVNYQHSQLKVHLRIGMLIRLISIFLCAMFIYVSLKKGDMLFTFILFFISCFLFEAVNLRTFMKYRIHFEPRICFSRKDNAVFTIDKLGNLHKTPWKDVVWYVILTHHYGLGGGAGDTYALNCSAIHQSSPKFYNFLNPVYEVYSYSEKDSMQRLEGIYNFIHYYMEHGLEGLNTAYASEKLSEEGELPTGVTLLPPSPPFKPDKEFSSRSDLIKDAVWRFIFFPFYPKLLLDIRPQLRKFPFETPMQNTV